MIPSAADRSSRLIQRQLDQSLASGRQRVSAERQVDFSTSRGAWRAMRVRVSDINPGGGGR